MFLFRQATEWGTGEPSYLLQIVAILKEGLVLQNIVNDLVKPLSAFFWSWVVESQLNSLWQTCILGYSSPTQNRMARLNRKIWYTACKMS